MLHAYNGLHMLPNLKILICGVVLGPLLFVVTGAGVLLPDCDDDDLVLPVTPLDDWLARRPVRLTGDPRPGYRTNALRDAEWRLSTRLPAVEAGLLGKHSAERMDRA